jgi:hypothetical protein
VAQDFALEERQVGNTQEKADKDNDNLNNENGNSDKGHD